MMWYHTECQLHSKSCVGMNSFKVGPKYGKLMDDCSNVFRDGGYCGKDLCCSELHDPFRYACTSDQTWTICSIILEPHTKCILLCIVFVIFISYCLSSVKSRK